MKVFLNTNCPLSICFKLLLIEPLICMQTHNSLPYQNPVLALSKIAPQTKLRTMISKGEVLFIINLSTNKIVYKKKLEFCFVFPKKKRKRSTNAMSSSCKTSTINFTESRF